MVNTLSSYCGSLNKRNEWRQLQRTDERYTHSFSESVLAIIAKIVVWLILLSSRCKRIRGLVVTSVVSLLIGLFNSILYLLECLFGLWVAILIGVQLNGDLVVVSLDILFALLHHSFDKQSEWRNQELVCEIHLIVRCLFASTDILLRMVSGVSLPRNHAGIWRVKGASLPFLLGKKLNWHLLGLIVQCLLLLLQEFAFIYSLMVLHLWVEMLLFLLLHFNSSLFK